MITRSTKHLQALALLTIPLVSTTSLHAEDAELAKKLANPVAAMISAPVQGNVDFGVGPGDGTRSVTNIQPVVPFELSEHWNLISRTVLPVIDQDGIDLLDSTDAFGLGDTLQTFFFSPKDPNPFIWGIGPAIYLPTATDSRLGLDKWGAGPSLVALKQCDGWTYGVLANHLWDFAGNGSQSLNSTFIQPFLNYTTKSATSFILNSESTYDWQTSEWTVPVNFMVAQMVKFGDQPVQFFGGARYYLDKPANGPEWGLRLGFTFLFPKG
ncbi:transporter [Haloferula chungangensis]|uniref:Transporter n=1 Tax=Haloferula chungangensis TaxID=1048331 RepID=A0ABW2L2A2_9BACT